MRTFGDKVSIHYAGSLITGEVFDDHINDDPLEITIGISAVLPGLEHVIASMEVGQERTITIPSDKAYGAHDPEGVIKYPRYLFAKADDLVEGQLIEFYSDEGALCAYPKVISCSDEYVILDFNHPLAGKDLVYWVKIESEMVSG